MGSIGGGFGKGGGRTIDPREMFAANAQYNRLNQYTPFGSVEYSGPYNNIVTETMSPEMLALMNQQMGARGGALANLLGMYGWSPTDIQNPGGQGGSGGGGGGGPMPEAPMGPESYGTGGGAGGSAYGDIIGSLPGLGENLPGLDPNLDIGSLPDVNYNLDLGSLPGYENLDLSQLQQIPGEGDLMGLRGDVEQAYFDRARALVDPVYAEQEQRLAETYANRGMPVGAEERDQEFNRFDTNRSAAYDRLAQGAVQYGGQEMTRMLQDAMGLRGQGLGEQLALFGTGMQGRQQGLQELLSQAGLGMQGREQGLAERLAQLGASGQVRNQLFGENMGTRQQLYNELMGTRGAEFGQLASILGLAGSPGSAGGLGGFYGPGQVDVSGIAGIYQGGQNARYGTDAGIWGNLISTLLGGTSYSPGGGWGFGG